MDSASSNDLSQALATHVLTQINPKVLTAHPWNSAVYGKDEDVEELISLINNSKWVKPLVVTPIGVIISGHRRWKAVLALGWESVPVEVKDFVDELSELEALLLENASRLKTTEQKVREGQAWSEIEQYRAKQRQQQAAVITNQKLGRDNCETLMENFPQPSKGTTRDAIASRVGLGSGRTYSKAAKVVVQIDEAASQGHPEIAQALRKILNEQSVDAAYTLLKKTPKERQAIAQLIANGDAKSTNHARKMIRQNNYTEFSDSSTNSFPSQYQVSDIVFVDIDRQEAVLSQERRFNGFWGVVTKIGELGSLTVNVGSQSLHLFPRDLRPIDILSNELQNIVRRVLRLRSLELDEIEQRMLDVIQRREWFTTKQLIHLENIEKLYPLDRSWKDEQQASNCRSP